MLKSFPNTLVLFLVIAITQQKVFAVETSALSSPQWQWQLGATAIYQQLREEKLHKLRNHGPVILSEAVLNRRSSSNKQSLKFHLPIGVLIDRYGFPVISFQYGFEAKGFWPMEKQTSVGYLLQANARYRYFPEWDDAHLYWLSDYSFGPALLHRIQQYPGLSLQAGMALFSWVSVSPQHRLSKFDNILTLSGFFDVPQQNLKFKHLGEFQNLQFNLNYQPAKHPRQHMHYEMRLIRLLEALQYVEVWHGLGWRYAF